ncbi:alpha/beta fold hydrolase [Kibdelosporangium persicum]|uniref:Beta-ketoadipate enol-lactone hydrolase n=1 Tax=Kibdelosporangium persicum TaxID=2698649 RepID=A0ABX2FHD6_9PSEU|nr:alpha/beta fold hydrolase [Kibdelosporangium persicum]NRN70529.1 Beta-ketoadipate enol-lactone hydrolase [Kibdelosporangium persicum]
MRDLLLLHGAGAQPSVWDEFIPLMPGFRCVAPDLTGLTTWEAMLDHLEGLGLDNPAVVGHSLGGALGVKWAHRHPECPGVVNFDGHGHPSTYPGLTDAEVGSWKAKLKELFDEMAKQMPPEHVALRPLIDNGSVHDLYDGLTARHLAVVADKLMTAQEPFADFYNAMREGVLADLAGHQVVRFDGSHAMLQEQPRKLAELSARFLSEE